MDKLDEFKSFIKDKQFLIEKVKSKEYTWQDLYEIYDLYGKEANVFNNNTSTTGEDKKMDNNDGRIANLLKAFEGVDVNKINDNLEGVRKILAVLGEFSKKDDVKPKRTYERPSNRYDD